MAPRRRPPGLRRLSSPCSACHSPSHTIACAPDLATPRPDPARAARGNGRPALHHPPRPSAPDFPGPRGPATDPGPSGRVVFHGRARRPFRHARATVSPRADRTPPRAGTAASSSKPSPATRRSIRTARSRRRARRRAALTSAPAC